MINTTHCGKTLFFCPLIELRSKSGFFARKFKKKNVYISILSKEIWQVFSKNEFVNKKWIFAPVCTRLFSFEN